METLGYGSHLVIDGYGSAAPLMDEAWVKGAARELLTFTNLPEGHQLEVSHWFPDGVSVALVLPAAHLTLHTFAGRNTVCGTAFSPHMLTVQGIGEQFRALFKIGRLEGHLTSHSVVFTQDERWVRTTLIGERNYMDVRLDDALLD